MMVVMALVTTAMAGPLLATRMPASHNMPMPAAEPVPATR